MVVFCDDKTLSKAKKHREKRVKIEEAEKPVFNLENLSALLSPDDYRKKQGIQVQLSKGMPDHFPFIKFKHSYPLLPKGLSSYFDEAGFSQPTPIQSQSWPFIFAGKDVIGIAETGSGKTLAFGFPALAHVKNFKTDKNGLAQPSVLVLAPTRELACQIFETLEKGLKCMNVDPGIHALCLFGGCSKAEQVYKLSKSIEVIVATPGRLLDILNDGHLSLERLSYLVFDEADRMLDFGFEPDIRRIIGFTNPSTSRQTLMFSATWPMSIRKMAQDYLDHPVLISVCNNATITADQEIGPISDGSIKTLKGAVTIQQHVQVVQDPYQKEGILMSLLAKYKQNKQDRIIIFALYKKEAARLEEMLGRKGYNVAALHGDKSQTNRFQVLQDFKDGKVPLLVATDVAARGLDIPHVELVINYTFPLTIEDYVHRIGRTGRAGQKGIAVTLFTPLDKSHSGELIQVLRNSNQSIPDDLMQFGTTIKKKEHKDYGAFYKEVDPNIKGTHVVYDD